MTVREETERVEELTLSPYACRAAQSRGRARPLEACPMRTAFQRDIDRIVHSKAFRRLMHKTQVFLAPEGDHYRTRMTHTLEVSRIARTIARGLRLNEDLTEAAALGHDLGHTPFGHAGERALSELMPGGFAHNVQSLRVVERLENGGAGLNLTWEIRNGILCHTGEDPAATLEGRIIRLADQIAYINHDIDDAIRGGVLYPIDIPLALSQRLGFSHGARIDALGDGYHQDQPGKEYRGAVGGIRPGHGASCGPSCSRPVYRNPAAKSEEGKARGCDPVPLRALPAGPGRPARGVQDIRAREGSERAACDDIAGTTDPYAAEAVSSFPRLPPRAWAAKRKGGGTMARSGGIYR